MSKRLQRGADAYSHPLWLRAIATACLLLVGFASSAQAVHVHGDLLPKHAQQVGAPADASQVPGGEEHCPLCVAMHSALPVATRSLAATLVLVECRLPTLADRLPASQWHFAMFSRPPPAVIRASFFLSQI